MSEDEVRSTFTLAGIEVLNLWKTDNQYQGVSYRTNPDIPPWWLVQTPVGMMILGWRSRVIEMDWENTPIRINQEHPLTKDDVTKTETYIHAYGLPKAVEYLTEFRKRFSSVSTYSYSSERPDIAFARRILSNLHPTTRRLIIKDYCYACGETNCNGQC
jgi:hypothetical protein